MKRTRAKKKVQQAEDVQGTDATDVPAESTATDLQDDNIQEGTEPKKKQRASRKRTAETSKGSGPKKQKKIDGNQDQAQVIWLCSIMHTALPLPPFLVLFIDC